MDEKEFEDSNTVRHQGVVLNANDYTTTDIDFDRCEMNRDVELDAQYLSGIGRYLNLSVTVRKVCPCKRIAIGMALYEKAGNLRVLKGHKSFVASHSECG